MLQLALNTSLVSQRGLRLAYLVEDYGQAGDYEKAEQIAWRTLEDKCSPFNQTIALMNLGKIRVRQNRLPEAIALFEQSLAADPTPDGYFIFDWAWLGEVARLQNKPVEAEAFFKKSVAYESGLGWEDMPPKEEAYYLYGNFLLRQNRLAEAAAPVYGAEVVDEPDITDTIVTEFNCELGNKITIYTNENEDGHIALRWKKRVHRLSRVGTTTGAQRFENPHWGLIWIGIPAKGILLDSKLNRQLANECKNAEQAAPVVAALPEEKKS